MRRKTARYSEIHDFGAPVTQTFDPVGDMVNYNQSSITGAAASRTQAPAERMAVVITMPPPSRQYRVHREDLNKGSEIESREHPSFGERSTRRIARDHLQKYGPGYYRAEKFNEKTVENINTKMRAKPMKRKRREPDGILFDPQLRRLGLY